MRQSQVAAIAVGKQPKAVPNLVSVFAQICAVPDVPANFTPRLANKRHLACCYKFIDSKGDATLVHTGAKLLRRTSKTGGVPDAPTNEKQLSLEALAKTESQDVSATVFLCDGEHVCKAQTECKHHASAPTDQVVFGIPWEPVQFVKKVASAGHPRNIVSGLSQVLLLATEEAASFS